MATTSGTEGKVTQLYSDIGKTKPIYPKTSTKCVYDEFGTNLEQLNKVSNTRMTNAEKRLGTTEYYTATLLLSGWTTSNSKYTQTVSCSGITSAMNGNFDQPKTEHSTNVSTDAALQEGLQALCASGYSITAANGTITWTTSTKPAIDIPVYLSKATTK